MTEMESVSTVRLFGAVIALVSGLYSVYLSVSGPSMTGGGWFMLALGVVVVVHGVVLLTPAARRLGTASGPLMIGYAALMLLNQFRLATGWMVTRADGMDGGMGGSDMMGSTTTMAMGSDAGMVAIAALMLASGLIMTVRGDVSMMDAEDGRPSAGMDE
jgi:hypothetical protein